MTNGLNRIDFHITDQSRHGGHAGLVPTIAKALPDALPLQKLDYDAAARHHLGEVLAAPAHQGFVASPAAPPPDLDYEGVDELALTRTVVARYQQRVHRVPVYGATLGVEMDHNKDLVSIAGAVQERIDVDPVATVSPAAARDVVKHLAHVETHESLDAADAPDLVYRFDAPTGRWHLAYMFAGVTVYLPSTAPALTKERARSYRFFIDAHSGEELARVPMLATAAVDGNGTGADGKAYVVKATQTAPNLFTLEDPDRRIRTHSLQFGDVNCGPLRLPGRVVSSETSTFTSPSAVAAHANAARVYDFLLNELKRNSIDGRGMWLVSTVDCLDVLLDARTGQCAAPQPGQTDWENAFWDGEQMVYGQVRWTDGRLHSLADSPEIVGHEMTHGITDRTCGLEYQVQSGALNESYSDIFGIAISNADAPDVATWDWELGEQVFQNHQPFRDLRSPGRFQQPEHMRDLQELSEGQDPDDGNDYGFVHTNSGIHNKAAFNVFTCGVFTWREAIQMFYQTLVTAGRLGPTSSFSDAKAGMIASCKSLFRASPHADLVKRTQAVEKAFADVGI